MYTKMKIIAEMSLMTNLNLKADHNSYSSIYLKINVLLVEVMYYYYWNDAFNKNIVLPPVHQL